MSVMSRVRGWFTGQRRPARVRFSTTGPIDALVAGVWGPGWGESGPVSREQALSVAAVERGRDEICSVATLPLVVTSGLDQVPNSFLLQPDPDVPKVVHYAQTLEDLLMDGISWWVKTAVDYRGFPLSVRRVVNVSLVAPTSGGTPAPLPSGQDPRGASVWVDGVETPASLMIRFDSPGRPLLQSGARSVRRALMLDALAAMYAENPRPLETFTDTDNQTVVPYSDEDVDAFLAAYRTARKRGGPAWIPKQAQRIDVSAPSPAELQLVELQREVSLELALHMGLDPEDVGVNTTSRTYFNATDRRTDKINRTLGPYMAAITDRLSMGDVTPRGQAVTWDTTEWLRPDAPALAAYWAALKGAGAIDATEVRHAAGWSGPAPAAGGAQLSVRAVQGQLGPALTAQRLALPASFAADPRPAMRFCTREFAADVKPTAADVQKRTVTGLAVPYGAIARKYGVGFRFRPGSLEFDSDNIGRLRAMDGHHTYVGVHEKVDDTKAGPFVTLKVLDGPEGSPTKMHRDQLLMDAAGGLADGLSIGVDFSLDPTVGDVVWSEGEQVFDVLRATWNETSITPDPAFAGARVTRVNATSGGAMNCQHCQHPHPPGMACTVAAQLYPAPATTGPGAAAGTAVLTATAAPPASASQAAVAPSAAAVALPGQFAAAALPSGQVSADQLTAALTAAVSQLVAGGHVAAVPPVEPATFVNPLTVPVPVKVTEPAPYRLGFDRRGQAVLSRGTHDFSQDFFAWFSDADKAAHDRALAFIQDGMSATFAVATGDVDELNPTRQRPDMFVDQRAFRYPFWDACNKGSLADITPFAFPKFNTAAGLVGPHVEGTEPTGGSYTTTGQTVTPTAYSGKAVINREVWDQGGNPQISTLIWNQMTRGVAESLEAAIVALLNAGTFTSLGTLTAGVADRAVAGRVLGAEIEAAIAALQFARGGYAFTDAFGQADLYAALAAARSVNGEPIYPMIGPANRNGSSGTFYSAIVVGGQEFAPAWALSAAGQTAAAKSYLIDRASVHGWASPPQRLTLDQTAVATVALGVWGYQATAVSDNAGVRTISWDPVA